MKLCAVLDSSIMVSGVGWREGSARSVLVILARRGFISIRTRWLTAEWAEVVERVAQERQWKNPNWGALRG